MRSSEVRALYEDLGPYGFLSCVRDLIEGRTLPNGQKLKMRPEDFSIRALWEGLIGPCEDTLPSNKAASLFVDVEEQIDSSSFVAATRLLLAAKVIEGYNQIAGVGDLLVTTMPSKRRLENIAGFTDLQGLEEVAEGEAYKESSMGDKYVTSQAAKRGRLLSVTEEAVREDNTGQLLMRAGRLGEIAATDREEVIISGILDLNANIWRPSGVATALYSVANLNLLGNGSTPGRAAFKSPIGLHDWTQLQMVYEYHATTIRTDPQIGAGKPIIWNPQILLVPSSLEGVAKRIINATEVESRTATAALSTAQYAEVARFLNPFAGRLTVVSSPFIQASGISNAELDWYVGDHKKQFIWQEVIPVQVARQDSTGPEMFERDILVRFKVRYFGGVGCLDTRYVIKVLGV